MNLKRLVLVKRCLDQLRRIAICEKLTNSTHFPLQLSVSSDVFSDTYKVAEVYANSHLKRTNSTVSFNWFFYCLCSGLSFAHSLFLTIAGSVRSSVHSLGNPLAWIIHGHRTNEIDEPGDRRSLQLDNSGQI